MAIRRLSGFLLALLLVAIGAGSMRQVAYADTDAAVKEYGACLNGQKQGDLLILIDESGSLKETDPEGARVTAARYLVNQLNDLAERLSVDFSVSVAGFSDDYHEVLDWTLVDAAGTPKINAALDEFHTRTDGPQTDYWNGLNGARSELSRRAKGDPERCQALVWFSDGAFNVHLTDQNWEQHPDARVKKYAPQRLDLRKGADARRAEDAAVKDLCRNGGLADQLRVGKITLFGIGLTSPKGASSSDFETMRRIAEGSDGCGQRTTPPGGFTAASNIDELIFALRQIDPVPPIVVPINVCAETVEDVKKCRDKGLSFVLDSSITSVRILATTDLQGAELYLFYPDTKQDPVSLNQPNGRLSPPGSRYTRETDQSTSIALANRSRKAEPWTGRWTLVYRVDPGASVDGASKVAISISGNLAPAWPKAQETKLITGDSYELQFGLADDLGNEVDSASLKGTGEFSAQLVTADGKVIEIGSLDRIQDLTTRTFPPLSLAGVPVGRAELKLTLELTTARYGVFEGTKLNPQIVNLPVTILPAPGMPQLAPLIDFGTVEGTENLTATADLPITGPGCVWLPAGTTAEVHAGPDGVVPTISSPSNSDGSCVRVAEGATGSITFQLAAEQAGNGTLAGNLPVTIAPIDQPDRATVVHVPFTADLQRPLRTERAIAAFVAALIIGPGLPLLLLALIKRLTAVIPGQALLARDIPVAVGGNQVLREGAPLALRDTDFRDLVHLKSGGSRSAEVPGATLKARTGWSPFGAGFVEVLTPGRVGLSSKHPKPYGRRRSARLPLAVHNSWFVTHDPAGQPDAATVVLLVGTDAMGDQRQRLVDDVQARLPALMALLRAGGPPGTDGTFSGGGVPTSGGAGFDFATAATPTAPADPYAGWGDAAPEPTPPSQAPPSLTPPGYPHSQSTPRRHPPERGPQKESAAPAEPATEWTFDASFGEENRGTDRY